MRMERSSLSKSLSHFQYLVRASTLICAYFFSATGYSDGYQLNTSLKTPTNDDLERCWLGAVVSSEVDMICKTEDKVKQMVNFRMV